jgi:hypothetical protein
MGPAAHAGTGSAPDNRRRSAAVSESSSLLSEIVSLLETPADDPPDRDVVEHTLTNGYAHALRLEGRRLRIEDRLRSVVRGETGGEADELTVELARADQELADLRGLLSTLKAQALT